MWGAGGEGFGSEHVGGAAGAGGGGLLGGGCGFGGGGFVDRYAVEEADGAAGDGGDAVAGDQDAGEIQWVGGGYDDCGFGGAGGLLGAGLAERVAGFGQGILLAERAADEAAAANLAAGFETAEDGEKVAPLGGVGFAGEELAEEDAVAAEKDAGMGVEGSVGLLGGGDGAMALGFGGIGEVVRAGKILRSHP